MQDGLEADMTNEDIIRKFDGKQVRTVWVEDEEEWYFSVVDVVAVLTDQPDSRHAAKYWSVLKTRLKDEGSELTTNCSQFKMRASDGKMRKTDAANTEQLLRIVQSIPSKKAEPFKLWLAKVGAERIDEEFDPEIAIERAMQTYLRKGYSPDWINQRLQSIKIRKELTDEWQRRGVSAPSEFAILTDEITKAWSDMTTREYKTYKGLKKENLRDNMSTLELVIGMLGEATTAEISRQRKPDTFDGNRQVAKDGGGVARGARELVEQQTGVPVVTSGNAETLGLIAGGEAPVLVEGVGENERHIKKLREAEIEAEQVDDTLSLSESKRRVSAIADALDASD